MVPVIPLARSEAMKAATLAISVSVETSFPVASGGDQLAELFPRDAPRVRGDREDLLDRVAFRHTGGSQAKDANAARSELCPDRLRVSCSTAAIAGPKPPIKATPSLDGVDVTVMMTGRASGPSAARQAAMSENTIS